MPEQQKPQPTSHGQMSGTGGTTPQGRGEDKEKKEQQSKAGSSAGGGNGKSGGGSNGGGDDPVKAAAQAIVAFADDPAMLGPSQQLRDLVEALKKALAAGEEKK